MIDKIKSLINKKQYTQALNLIEEELSQSFDYTNEEEENKYGELISLRVTANTLLGKKDDIILDSVRKEKYPSEKLFEINKNKVTLLYKNLFLFECDAYVNTIHVDKKFDVPPPSTCHEFIKRLSKEHIQRETEKQKNKGSGDFILLEHPDALSAPLSYHILCYEGEKELNYDALKTGLFKVFEDAIKRKLTKIGIIPLGFDIVVKTEDKKKNEVADQVASFVAETIVRYLWDSKPVLPHLYFNFVRTNSFQTFERAFYRWSSLDKNYLQYQQQLDEKSKLLIEEVNTQNPDYINLLMKLKPELNGKSSILLLGETGVGKSYLAKLIHKQSIRSASPFVAQNCALVKRESLYQLIFGWKRGSYTDAKEDGTGVIHAAEGGTLFLDEIGYTDIDVQRAMLTFLDNGSYKRYGDQKEIVADVRLIFGTNQDISALIQERLFQADLYERISQLELNLPPLRERKGDILLLINSTLRKLNDQNKFNLSVDESVKQKLMNLKWPGNIRQLIFYIARMFNYCLQNNIYMVPEDWIDSNPPRDNLYTKTDPLSSLENNLTNILQKWDGEKGKLLEDIIEPILAKIYIDILDLPKHTASKILGIDGSAGKNSRLDRCYEKYPNCKKLFQNNK